MAKLILQVQKIIINIQKIGIFFKTYSMIIAIFSIFKKLDYL